MTEAQRYRVNAIECLEAAARTYDEIDRTKRVAMDQEWILLAQKRNKWSG
jgi:hypothetical protein